MKPTGWLLQGPGAGVLAALIWQWVAERRAARAEPARFFTPGEVDRLLSRLDGWQDATLPISGLTNPKRFGSTNLSQIRSSLQREKEGRTSL